MVVMVVEDPRASRSATTASFTPEQLAAMTRFVSTPPEGDDNVRKPEIGALRFLQRALPVLV
jgi:hypothetical protein